jgi:hypothetical protein
VSQRVSASKEGSEMSEGYRSHVVEPPDCFGEHLDLGSNFCLDCLWLEECEDEVYEKWLEEEEKEEKEAK